MVEGGRCANMNEKGDCGIGGGRGEGEERGQGTKSARE